MVYELSFMDDCNIYIYSVHRTEYLENWLSVMKVVLTTENGRKWAMGSFDCPGELSNFVGNFGKITLKEVEISYGSHKSLLFFIKPLGKFPKFLSGKTVCQRLCSPQYYKIILSHDLWHSTILLAFQSILIFPPSFLLMSVRIQSDFLSDKWNSSSFQKHFSTIYLGPLTICLNLSVA